MTRWKMVIIIGGVLPMLLAGCRGSKTGEDAPVKDVSYGKAESATPAELPHDKGPLIGTSVADFSDKGLVNQEGEPVSFKTAPKQPLLVSFIYTRCPMATMCPRITQKVREVQKRLNSNGDAKAKNSSRFILITLDPEHDKPGILKEYGRDYNVDYGGWEFWTGPKGTITNLASRFQVTVKWDAATGETNALPHTMRTYLIDTNRIVRFWFPGSRWQVEEVVKRLRALQGTRP